jgi:Transposase and inactivated derivatives
LEDVKTYYRRHLPHYQPEFAIFHVVFRLAGSLPVHVIEELRQEQGQLKREANDVRDIHIQRSQSAQLRKLYFERFNALLDHASSGPTWLKEPEVGAIVKEAIHHRDGELYNLLAYCIMPNHVHLLFELLSSDVNQLAGSTNEKKDRDRVSTYKVTKIIESLKKYTALRANLFLKRSGVFWQHESYDHVIRDNDELENTLWYILFNPVKARLVSEWEQWKSSYCKPELLM